MKPHDPGNVHPYDKLWALLSIDEKGNEGIIGLNGPAGPMQAITGSKTVLLMMKDAVLKTGQDLGDKKIVLAEYTRTNSEMLR